MTELKPCPFCGIKPGISRTEYEYKGSDWGHRFTIYCVHCSIEITGYSSTDMLTARERATERWNRRA